MQFLDVEQIPSRFKKPEQRRWNNRGGPGNSDYMNHYTDADKDWMGQVPLSFGLVWKTYGKLVCERSVPADFYKESKFFLICHRSESLPNSGKITQQERLFGSTTARKARF